MNLKVSQLRMIGQAHLYKTEYRHQFIDVTDRALELVGGLEISTGQLTVFSRHTTAGIIINEAEPLLLNDLKRFLDRIAGPGEFYEHDDLTRRTVNLVEGEPPNGHSHCQHLVIGCSVTVPVLEGSLKLGRWQRIFLLELDGAREREVIFQAQGF